MSVWEKNVNKSIQSYIESTYEKLKSYERFHFVGNIIKEKIEKHRAYEFLDIGCAKGEFIYYYKELFANIRFTGVEFAQELILLAEKNHSLKMLFLFKGTLEISNYARNSILP